MNAASLIRWIERGSPDDLVKPESRKSALPSMRCGSIGTVR